MFARNDLQWALNFSTSLLLFNILGQSTNKNTNVKQKSIKSIPYVANVILLLKIPLKWYFPNDNLQILSILIYGHITYILNSNQIICLFLKKRFEVDLLMIGADSLPGWMAYSLARASLKLENFDEARRYSLLTLKSSVPLKILVKAAITLAVSALKIRC